MHKQPESTMSLVSPTRATAGRSHAIRRQRDRDGKRSLPPVDPERMRVTVLIPAHNEANQITDTIASLKSQHRRPDRVLVIADNCSDATEGLAQLCGADVIGTRNNRHKKAGAQNQNL